MDRHLLSAVLLLCIASACDKQADIGTSGQTPVAFSVSPAATRAGALTDDNLSSMGVFAYYTGQDNWTTSAVPGFMYNERVSRTSGTSPWTYEPVKYWPNTPGDKISYFAYAPHTDDDTNVWLNNTAANANEQPGAVALTHMVPQNAKLQTDLLVGVPLLNRTKGDALAFEMKHCLTRVLVEVKCADALSVANVSLRGSIHGYGKLVLTASGPEWEGFTVGSPSYGCPGPVAVPANTTTQVAEFFMLPMSKVAAVGLSVDYSYGGYNDKQSLSLPDTPAWEMGKTIAYTLNIETGSQITLSVKTWDTNTANNGTMGEDAPTTGYPFLKNGIIYESTTKFYYVSSVCYYDVTGDGWGQADGETSGWYQWDPAIRICRGIYSFGPYGKGEWRLPTIYELDNVVRFGLNGSSLWSSTDAGNGKAWKYRGDTRETTVYTGGHRLLCIRDIGSELGYPTSRRVGGFSVVHFSSSKSYMVAGSNEVKVYSNAVTYCSGLNSGGYNDWRLPTYEEATWVLNLGVRPSTTYWTSATDKAIVGSYKSVGNSGGGWLDDAPAGVLKARTFCVRDY